jgi:actin-related protein
MVPSAVALLASTGRQSGLVIDCGYERTTVVPVVNGEAVEHAARTVRAGGHHITKDVLRVLRGQPNSGAGGTPFAKLSSAEQLRAAQLVKETHCSVEEMQAEHQANGVDHADQGSSSAMRSRVSKCARVIFGSPHTPHTAHTAHTAHTCSAEDESDDDGEDEGYRERGHRRGLLRVIKSAVGACHASVCGLLCANVVFAGGGSLLPGFTERVEEGIRTFAPAGVVTSSIPAPIEHAAAAFDGCRVLLACGYLDDLWLGE